MPELATVDSWNKGVRLRKVKESMNCKVVGEKLLTHGKMVPRRTSGAFNPTIYQIPVLWAWNLYLTSLFLNSTADDVLLVWGYVCRRGEMWDDEMAGSWELDGLPNWYVETASEKVGDCKALASTTTKLKMQSRDRGVRFGGSKMVVKPPQLLTCITPSSARLHLRRFRHNVWRI
jgi:hypothetical protein